MKVMVFDEAAIQIELVEIQAAGDMKVALHGAESLSTFWVSCPQDYGTLKTLAMYVLTMFGSTYTCEAALSKINLIKNTREEPTVKAVFGGLFAHQSDSCQT